MLSPQVVFIVSGFLSHQDIYALRLTCKSYEKSTKHPAIWRRLAERDFHRKVESENDYFICTFLIKQSRLDRKMAEEWCIPYSKFNRINSNGLSDHIPKAILRHLCMILLKEETTRQFYDMFSKDEIFEWRVLVNSEIEKLVSAGETCMQELKEYVSMK